MNRLVARSETQRSPFTRSASWNPRELRGPDFDCTYVLLFLDCKVVFGHESGRALVAKCTSYFLSEVSFGFCLWENAQASSRLTSVSDMRSWPDAQVCSRLKCVSDLRLVGSELDTLFVSAASAGRCPNSRATRLARAPHVKSQPHCTLTSARSFNTSV